MKSDLRKMDRMDMPRERLLTYGKENLSNDELIAIILRTGDKKRNVKELALYLLSYIGGIEKLKDLNYSNLLKIDGIGETKATLILAVVELSKRLNNSTFLDNKMILNKPDIIVNYFYDLFEDKDQEEFYVVYLDVRKRYIDKYLLFRGTYNSSLVHPREIFKNAYLLSSDSIICIHNHPSGEVEPSKQDILITKKIQEISIIHSIKLVDHLIIGKHKYFSFFENNMLKTL